MTSDKKGTTRPLSLVTRHLPFDFAQGRESLDVALDPERVEGLVERSLVTH